MSFPDRFDHNNRHSSYDLESLRIAFDDWNEKSKSELLEDKGTAKPDIRMASPRSRAILPCGTSGMRPMKQAAHISGGNAPRFGDHHSSRDEGKNGQVRPSESPAIEK